MAFTDFLHLLDTYVSGVTRYSVRQIQRVHRVLNAVARNSGSPYGAGIFKRPNANSYRVTAGAGFVVNINEGVASLAYKTGFIVVQNPATQFSLVNWANRDASNPIYLHIAATPGVLGEDDTPQDDVAEKGAASFAVLDTDTQTNYICLAKITTSGTGILSVVDMRANSFVSGEAPATTTTLGTVRLSTAPANAAQPVVATISDPLIDVHARNAQTTLDDADEFGVWKSSNGAYNRITRLNVFKNFFALLASKGMLIVGTGGGNVAALPVGANNLALIADSTSATGLKYGNPIPAAHTHTSADISDFADAARDALEISTGAPVDDTNALRAVAPADRQNGQSRYVESKTALYFFQEGALGSDDDDTTILPSSGTGAWFRRSGGGTGNADTLGGYAPAYYRDRANHTGTQDVATITGLGDGALLDVGVSGGLLAFDDISRTNERFPSNDALLVHQVESGDIESNRYGASYINARNIMVGRMFYDSARDNTFYQGEKRFAVTCFDNNAPANFSYGDLFNNKYPSGFSVNPSHTLRVNIDLVARGEYDSTGIASSAGNLYLTFYQNYAPASVSARVRDVTNTWTNCGATTLLQSNARGQLWGLAMSDTANVIEIEITFTASPSALCWLCEIEYHRFDLNDDDALAEITHSTAQRLYNDWEFRNDQNETTIHFDAQSGIITANALAIGQTLTDFGSHAFTFSGVGLCLITCDVSALGEFESEYATFTDTTGDVYVWNDKVRSSSTLLAFIVLLPPENTYPLTVTFHFTAKGAFTAAGSGGAAVFEQGDVIPFGSADAGESAAPAANQRVLYRATTPQSFVNRNSGAVFAITPGDSASSIANALAAGILGYNSTAGDSCNVLGVGTGIVLNDGPYAGAVSTPAASGGYSIQGAGDTTYLGLYTEQGMYGTRPYYVNSNSRYLYFNPSNVQWELYNVLGGTAGRYAYRLSWTGSTPTNGQMNADLGALPAPTIGSAAGGIYIVTGSGTNEINGQSFTSIANINGRPAWAYSTYTINWTSTSGGYWVIMNGGSTLYRVSSPESNNAMSPPATGWVVETGAAPAPTNVSLSPSSTGNVCVLFEIARTGANIGVDLPILPQRQITAANSNAGALTQLYTLLHASTEGDAATQKSVQESADALSLLVAKLRALLIERPYKVTGNHTMTAENPHVVSVISSNNTVTLRPTVDIFNDGFPISIACRSGSSTVKSTIQADGAVIYTINNTEVSTYAVNDGECITLVPYPRADNTPGLFIKTSS